MMITFSVMAADDTECKNIDAFIVTKQKQVSDLTQAQPQQTEGEKAKTAKRLVEINKIIAEKTQQTKECKEGIAVCNTLKFDYAANDVNPALILAVLDGRQDGPLSGKPAVKCDKSKGCAVSFIIHTHGGVGKYTNLEPESPLPRWGPTKTNEKYLAGALRATPTNSPFREYIDMTTWQDKIEILQGEPMTPVSQVYPKGIHWEALAAISAKLIQKGAGGVFVLLKHCHSGGMLKWITAPNMVKYEGTDKWPIYVVASSSAEYESSADFSLPRFSDLISNGIKMGNTMRALVMRIKSEIANQYANDQHTPAGVYTPQEAGAGHQLSAHYFFGPQNA